MTVTRSYCQCSVLARILIVILLFSIYTSNNGEQKEKEELAVGWRGGLTRVADHYSHVMFHFVLHVCSVCIMYLQAQDTCLCIYYQKTQGNQTDLDQMKLLSRYIKFKMYKTTFFSIIGHMYINNFKRQGCG